MDEHGAPPAVMFRVRFGKDQFMCRGHLEWDRGIVYAVTDEMPEDCPFVPDRLRLEEGDLELKSGENGGPDWYQYHGFIMVS